MNRVEMNDGKERLGIVNAICLGEAASNHMSLVTCNGTIMMVFEGEDPLSVDNVGICQTGNQVLSLSRNQGLPLRVHCRFP